MSKIHAILNKNRPKLGTINRILLFILAVLFLLLVIITFENKTSAITGAIFGLGSLFMALFKPTKELTNRLYSLFLIVILYSVLIVFICTTTLKNKIIDTYQGSITYLQGKPTSDLVTSPTSNQTEIAEDEDGMDEDLCMFTQGCLLSGTWNIYPANNYEPTGDGCLPFPDGWGVEITCNSIEIFPSDEKTEPAGNTFYLVLEGNIKISFDLEIESLSGNGAISYLAFGVSSINPETPLHTKPEKGLYFQREYSDNLTNIYYKNMWKSLDERYESYERTQDSNFRVYTENTSVNLAFNIDGNELSIYENNHLLIGPLPILQENRGFWISYFFENTGELKATISNFDLSQID